MKSLVDLCLLLTRESGLLVDVKTSRDEQTITRRVECEGESFLTITLPKFGTAFEQCLAMEVLDPTLFPEFRVRRGRPVFLQGFLGLVFDDRGFLLANPNIEAIRFIRQITKMFKRVKTLCSDERQVKAARGYKKVEDELSDLDDEFLADLRRHAAALWGPYLSAVSSEIYKNGVVPRHGPGATATGELGNKKYTRFTWTERLEEFFPFGDHLFASPRQWGEQGPVVLPPEQEPPVKVVHVPKTASTTRVIAEEPVWTQYVQQGILRVFTDLLPRFPEVDGVCGWTDQSPNQRLARTGSINGGFATIDLSSASDRVTVQHVEAILTNQTFLKDCIMSCRSTRADVSGEILTLKKFASMGSALCFPMETMVFTTVVSIGLERSGFYQGRKPSLRQLFGMVRVFGDDIIVPAQTSWGVLDSLVDYGFVVNRDKTFLNGKFRESCGADWYSGSSVTPTYLSKPLPSSRSDLDSIVSLFEFGNHLEEGGYCSTADGVFSYLAGVLGFVPGSPKGSGGIGRWSGELVTRHHTDYHRPVHKAYVYSTPLPLNEVDGWSALLKVFTTPFNEDVNHFKRSGRPQSGYLSLRWVSS